MGSNGGSCITKNGGSRASKNGGNHGIARTTAMTHHAARGSNSTKTALVIDDSPTVRKLAEIVLGQNNYTVYTAEDGDEGLRITREIKPSVVLVDFIMPKMNGYMFCKRLRSDEALKHIPLVLITSKGEDVGQKFEEQFGVLHYFHKPFEPDELVQKLDDVLADASLSTAGESLEQAVSTRPYASMPPDFLGAVQERFDRVVRHYFQQNFPLLLKRMLADTLRETGVVRDDALILSGRIRNVSLPDVLQFAHVSRLSGKLSVISKNVFGEIYLEYGTFVFATVSKKDSNWFLTDLLLKDGRIDSQTLRGLVDEARESNRPIGRILVERNIITQNELTEYLKRQAQEAFNCIIDVTDGHFYLEDAPLPINLRDITLRVALPNVLVEGLRRLDEKQVAAAELRDDTIIFMRLITSEDALASVTLDDRELKIFALVDGKKTLGKIVEESRMESLEAKRICYSLQKIGLLRVRD